MKNLPILNTEGETMTFYHGTRRPFHRQGWLFPRSLHKGPETSAPRTDRPLTDWEKAVVEDAGNWVFLTELWEVARNYAIAAPGRGAPRILVIRPDLRSLERDPEHSLDFRAWRCKEARVLDVFINPPTLIEEKEEAS